jgi:hypothetical protein
MRITAFILATMCSLCVVSGAFAKPGVSSNGSSAVIKRELCSRVEIEGECSETASALANCVCDPPNPLPPDYILCPDGGAPKYAGIVSNCSNNCWDPDYGFDSCVVAYECCAPDSVSSSPLATE